MFRFRNSYANVTTTLALVVALGGTSYAAATITGKDIRDGSIKRVDLAPNAVTSAKVSDGSLRARDFRGRELPAGARGAPGPKGDAGPSGAKGDAGPAGANGATTVTVRRISASGTGQMDGTASCAAGERATGGGYYAGGNGGNVTVLNSYPVPLTDGATPTGWHVAAINQTNINAAFSGLIFAVCAAP